MNAAQDLGGMQGFGPIVVAKDEALDGPGRFHAAWERRAFAVTLAMGAAGEWNIDMARAARESLPPAEYLRSSYYRIWVQGLVKLMQQRGLLAPEELASGRVQAARGHLKNKLMAADVAGVLRRGSPYDRPQSDAAQVAAKFAVGDKVLTRNMHPSTHTRLPRYARAKHGRIARVCGVFVFPDSAAVGKGDDPQWLYSVEFNGKELWGSDTSADSVSVDCWESYLEPAR